MGKVVEYECDCGCGGRAPTDSGMLTLRSIKLERVDGSIIVWMGEGTTHDDGYLFLGVGCVIRWLNNKVSEADEE